MYCVKLEVKIRVTESLKFFVYSNWRSTYSKQRDQTMNKVVACKKLNTMGLLGFGVLDEVA